MSNYQVEPADRPQALSKEAIKALRKEQVQGVRAAQVLRTALGAGVGLWLTELTAGTIGFIWPAIADRQQEQGPDRHVLRREGPELEPADQQGLPGLLQRGQGLRDADRHRRARQFAAGRGADRRRRPTSTSGRSTSAARTSAASPTPASRTSGSSAPATARATTGSGSRPGRPVRPGAAEHGPLRGRRSTAAAS